MNSFCKVALPVTLICSGTLALAKEPEAPLKREGKWAMEYAEGACHLSAAFGTGKDQVIARFTQVGPDQSLRLSLFGKRLDNPSVFTRAQLTFLPSSARSEWQEVTNGSVNRADGKLPAMFVGSVRFDNLRYTGPDDPPLPAIAPEIEKSVSALHVRRGGGSFTLALETMGPPMAAMRKCIDNLVRHWGFEPSELAYRQSRAAPIGNPAYWARSSDYPSSMISEGSSAFVTFRAQVDAAGAVSDCTVLEATNPPTIGPHTCGLIKKRARFTPSRDKDGKPVPDFYINRVFWRMGG
ncbi:energy transducer TonB [Novosphingobium ginsenosidimutans]|uniref:Uncharacterized protein n=1 Tax=Novosphingobium ginsenosidimutans TaxID=1176536 RepID=A0A5B8S396_9SPHN|nr:energy transducer TonB [Novosphingobium ginsenosidimutans]QEA15850.1 hypothetical protein FRF71_06665 [Novosphingobium ginsenosidimutans]